MPDDGPGSGGDVIDLRTPTTVPENPRRGDEALIKSRGGTILPDDDPNSYRGNEKVFRDKNGSIRFEYLVGNEDALTDLDKKAAERFTVNGGFRKNKKGESYGTLLLADYVGYEPDLVEQGDGYLRWGEYNAAANTLHGLSKEECPHEWTYFVYNQEGEVIREEKGICQGHFEGKSKEYVHQARVEGKLW